MQSLIANKRSDRQLCGRASQRPPATARGIPTGYCESSLQPADDLVHPNRLRALRTTVLTAVQMYCQ